MTEVSDDVLLRRAGRGDADAFAALFDRHARRVFGYCFRQTGDWALAEDLTSVTFLELWRRRHSALVEEGKVLAWLFGIAHNVVRQRRRSLRRYRSALARLPVPAVEPDHAVESAERVAAERQAKELIVQLGGLPSPERAVVVLMGWEGLSAAETAEALSVPEATVRTRLYRARRRLQRQGEPDAIESAASPPSGVFDERTRV
jgi:RNA polymerase sigma factor (sigma-70 family)